MSNGSSESFPSSAPSPVRSLLVCPWQGQTMTRAPVVRRLSVPLPSQIGENVPKIPILPRLARLRSAESASGEAGGTMDQGGDGRSCAARKPRIPWHRCNPGDKGPCRTRDSDRKVSRPETRPGAGRPGIRDACGGVCPGKIENRSTAAKQDRTGHTTRLRFGEAIGPESHPFGRVPAAPQCTRSIATGIPGRFPPPPRRSSRNFLTPIDPVDVEGAYNRGVSGPRSPSAAEP